MCTPGHRVPLGIDVTATIDIQTDNRPHAERCPFFLFCYGITELSSLYPSIPSIPHCSSRPASFVPCLLSFVFRPSVWVGFVVVRDVPRRVSTLGCGIVGLGLAVVKKIPLKNQQYTSYIPIYICYGAKPYILRRRVYFAPYIYPLVGLKFPNILHEHIISCNF